MKFFENINYTKLIFCISQGGKKYALVNYRQNLFIIQHL